MAHRAPAALSSVIGIDAATDAILLPFVGRLGCLQPSQNPSHVKDSGGICVFRGWPMDFQAYLLALRRLLVSLPQPLEEGQFNDTVLADARTCAFPSARFDGLFTSPPYPNRADYASMFLPEIHYLNWIRNGTPEQLRSATTQIIGTVAVADRQGLSPSSQVALHFLDLADAAAAAHNKAAMDAQRRYYRPYFEEYFAGLEAAWRNVATALAKRSRGYIVVVNNTHRGLVVPVADFVVDTWLQLGFSADIVDTSEGTHFGTQNPRARGVRAVHSRHVVEIGG